MENKVLALVNGREITEADVASVVRRFPRERQAQLNSESGRRDVLDQIISFELIYNYARDNNLDQETDFTTQLENVKKEILTQYAINKVLSEVCVTESEIENYYEQNKDKFAQQESVRAKHILVDNIEEAQKIADEIKSGLSFEEAAAQHSKCPSNAQGGDLGSFTKGRMVPEFEQAAFDLPVGSVSEPVKTQFGYHLIKVESKQEATLKSLEEVSSVIKNEIIQLKQNNLYTNLTNELRSKFPVEII